MTPLVTAVVPTVGRPELVARAVRSVLRQTIEDVEVVVVLDGSDETTARAVAALEDPRVVMEVLPRRSGQPVAVNTGVARARAPWIGLLDDDDEWLPDKLERQLAAAERSRHRHPIIGGHLLVRSEKGERIWPRRAPKPGEPVSEYLFCRRSPFFGERLFQTSVLFAESALLRRVPFSESLPRHSDFDWLLRAAREDGVGIEFVPGSSPLAIWNADLGRPRVSNAPDWRFSVGWIRSRRELVTPRAYAAFLLTFVSAHAVQQGERGACAELLREAWRGGRPGLPDLVILAAIWGLPRRWREDVSHRLGGQAS